MSVDFYFAGVQCREADDEIARLNGNVLKSYMTDKRNIESWVHRRKCGWAGKFMIDNGAFTVHRKGGIIDIDEYIRWLVNMDEYIDYAVALDSIPGVWGQPRTLDDVRHSAEVTYANYLYMRDRHPHPHKLLPVYHQGEPIYQLDKFLELDGLNYIAISGSKDVSGSTRDSWLLQVFNTIRQSRNPNVNVHLLGNSKLECAKKFPIRSMDATSWILTGANGSVLTPYGVVYVGDDLRLLRSMSGEAESKIRMLCDSYGLTLEDLGSGYKARMVFNINYLIAESQKVEYQGYQKLRRLF